LETREGSPDLNTGITEQVFHAAGKIPLSKEHLKSINKGITIEFQQLKSNRAEIPSGPLGKLFLRE